MGQLDKALLFAEQHSQGIYHLMSQEARTRVGVCVCETPLFSCDLHFIVSGGLPCGLEEMCTVSKDMAFSLEEVLKFWYPPLVEPSLKEEVER